MEGYEISTDNQRLDVDVIHDYLARESYWARDRSREVVERSLEHSICFGLYAPDGTMAGFARVVTDRATVAWLCDVFVLPPHRGRGLGVWLVGSVLSHPDLQDLRQWTLGTRDAHELYRRFGFQEHRGPHDFMVWRPVG